MAIKRMQNNKTVSELKIVDSGTRKDCKVCIQCKMSRIPFNKNLPHVLLEHWISFTQMSTDQCKQ